MSAVREAPSRKAREGAHPQLFRYTFKDKPGLYFRVKVAHPPSTTGFLQPSLSLRNLCIAHHRNCDYDSQRN
jgi:hypothetical protein